jgi:FkbM family methyltransferase
VPLRVAGHKLRVERGCPLPVGSAYRRTSAEDVEDLAFMATVLYALCPGDTYLDVGSHFGLYALAAAALVGTSGSVVAFEPTPASASLVRRNVTLNGLGNRVRLEEAAVTDRPGTVSFTASGTSSQNALSTIAPFKGSSAARPDTLHVRAVALDAYFDPKRRTVAKIDVEGAELLVLRGARALLASPARVFVELHAWGWQGVEQGWAELQEIAAAAGRSIVAVDGRPIDKPHHQRVELARK